MRSKNIEYIEGLDHIRGLAALLVVFHHAYWKVLERWGEGLSIDAWVQTWNPLLSVVIETHIMVPLFFVLSGFLFSLGGAGRELAYGRFLRNRLLRVFPLYLTLIFFGMAVFPERTNLVGVLSSSTVLGNTIAGANFWPVSTTFWTVAIELQFYLIFPFLNTFLNRDGARPLIYLLLFAIGLRLVGFLLTNSIRDLNYWHLPGRIDSFLLGMLLARVYLSKNLRDMSGWWLVGGLMAFTGATLGVNRLGGFPAQEWWKALWPTVEAAACCALVVTYIAASRSLPRRVSRVLCWLGEVSFSVYLLHFMIIEALATAGLLPDLRAAWGLSSQADAVINALGVVIPLTLVLSFLSYRGIEAPFMALRGRYIGPSEERS